MRVLGCDPGPTQSALVILGDRRVLWHWIEPNQAILERLAYFGQCNRESKLDDELVIEQIASFGKPVGAEVFETVFWSGRFAQTWRTFAEKPFHRLKRHEVKSALCGSQLAKDPHIRRYLIDRFGGQSVAIGRKGQKGPLYGIHGDCWAALSVAITWQDKVAQKDSQ